MKKGVVRCYVVKGVWRSLLFVCLAANPSMTFPNRVLIESRFFVQPKHIWGFPVDAVVKNPPTNAGSTSLVAQTVKHLSTMQETWV